MRQFPSDFEDLLTTKGRSLLRSGRLPTLSREQRFVALHGIIEEKLARNARDLLRRKMYPHLRELSRGIPPETITGMVRNYSECLPKAMRLKSASLDSPESPDSRVAEGIGLLPMLRSESFRRFAETVTGFALEPRVGGQVLCYESGGYVGPHNDHHPESDPTMRGYVDVQITLADDGVEHQWLVYEKNHHLSEILSVAVPGLITVYWLPFWHYTTPLVTSPKRKTARRWLILGTFLIRD